MKEFPKVKPTQYVVLGCEIDTGIVLNNQFERKNFNSKPYGPSDLGYEDVYHVFDSLDEAETFCQKTMVEVPRAEFHIYDYNEVEVRSMSNDEYFDIRKKEIEEYKSENTFLKCMIRAINNFFKR